MMERVTIPFSDQKEKEEELKESGPEPNLYVSLWADYIYKMTVAMMLFFIACPWAAFFWPPYYYYSAQRRDK
ncbi:MAG TPA: hypothetical protein VF172_10290 [Nitrososphaera sp.]|jgi:hypothetical protein